MMPLVRFLYISLLFLTLSACQAPDEPAQPEAAENTAGMLQHTVYFYLNEDASPEQVKAFEEGLKELVNIDAIHKAEIGVPGSTEERDVTDHSFGYSIFTWFKTMEDYKVYADHPDHMKFIDEFSHLWADVKVYDSELTYQR